MFRFSVEENPWSTMEMDMRSNNLKTFTALQAHFTKQLVGKGMDTREARDQAGDSIMCFVVANFSDMMLRDMISRFDLNNIKTCIYSICVTGTRRSFCLSKVSSK